MFPELQNMMPKTESKALIVRSDVNELNQLLSEGWVVSHSCPQPSAVGDVGYHYSPQCLVIVSRLKPSP
jgi:hypothetical protein